MAKFVDTNWMNEAKKPRPVHCFNIYTGEDYGTRAMTDAELECFKGKQHYVPIFEKTSKTAPCLEEEDVTPGFRTSSFHYEY